LRAIARAATAIENRDPCAAEILKTLFPHTGKAATFGITGPPGAGKSTLVDQMTRALRREQERVGILAVDPTSPFSGGAILGDRIRMQSHHADPDVFIRSMATRGQLGGLAPATADLSLLLDAAGYQTILIETVGVGQDEVDIARLADVTAVVLVPGMGDDVQAIKAGIMEIGDVYVLNKADQPGIEKLEHELKSLLSLAPRPDGWSPPIVRCVASEGSGVDEVIEAMRGFHASGVGRRRLVQNWNIRLRAMFRERVSVRLAEGEVERAAERVASRETDPFTIVNDWLERY
jgi:LAO/AO transport system kinase